MNHTKALNWIENFRTDLMHVASLLQNNPEKFATAIETDETTFKEMKSLVGDLYSLTEVIEEEDK